MSTPTRTLHYDTKNSRVPMPPMHKAKRLRDGKLFIVHKLLGDGGKPPLDLQPEEQVWTTLDGEWELLTIAAAHYGMRCQSDVLYETQEKPGRLIDAAWFWRERPAGWEEL